MQSCFFKHEGHKKVGVRDEVMNNNSIDISGLQETRVNQNDRETRSNTLRSSVGSEEERNTHQECPL